MGPRSFESDVVPDSGKTIGKAVIGKAVFESDVVPDSGKTGAGKQNQRRQV